MTAAMDSEFSRQSDHVEPELHHAISAIVSACRNPASENVSMQSLLSENAILQTALAFMPLGFCMFDKQDRLQLCNQKYLEIWNLPAHLGRRGTLFADIMAASNEQEIELPDESLPGTPGQRRREFVTDAGVRIQVLVHVLEDGTVVALHKDITKNHAIQQKISFMAKHDILTGLCNRATLYERLDELLSPEAPSTFLTLLYLDLDAFKQVNDSMGHPVGDKLLQQASERLKDCCRSTDLVARLGGDEFAILMEATDIHDEHGAKFLAGKIITALTQHFHVDERPIQIGVSIGIASCSSSDMTPVELLKNADMALYEAKSKGGNLQQYFDKELETRERERQAFKVDLCKALENDEFELLYQPQVNASTMQVCGAEALIRWNHPSRGLVTPDEFIPLAEETGLIISIGRWVLHQACLEAKNWPESISISVNVSSVQFSDPNFLDDVVSAMNRCDLAPWRLELEITETVIMENVNATQALLQELKLRGVGIAIDDFGTGFSSLQYLRNFPVDKLKIDRSFVSNIDTESEALSIIRAITDLGSHLGKLTIAEGVETQAQLEIVQDLGCNETQGYLIRRPCSAADFLEFVSSASMSGRQVAGRRSTQ